jgi:hypothetical protein
MEIKIDCTLCSSKRSIFLLPDDKLKTMQCLSCGFASSDRYLGDQKDNEIYMSLTPEMKKMAVFESNRTWIPSLLTLPGGVLAPVHVEDTLFWSVVPAIDIPEDERKDYPNSDGGYYERKYDNNQTKLFNNFTEALKEVTADNTSNPKLNLPD